MPSFRPTPGTTGSRCPPPIRAWLLGGLVFVGASSGACSAGCSGLFARHDPESEARRALEDLSRTGLELGSLPQPARLTKLELSEIEVDGQDPPSVLFHVVATGTYGEAALGYYGSEHVTLRRPSGRVDGRLVAPISWLPKLAGVLRALAARDAAPFGASDSLSIRIDGDQASVSSLEGATRHTASLQKLGDSWHF